VPGRVLFKEDFFERVTDVNWQSEKKCFFMVGDISQVGLFSVPDNGFLYTSDDGMVWSAGKRYHTPGGLYGFTSGLWMRKSFEPDGEPLWILGGQGLTNDQTDVMSGLAISHEGKAFVETRFFDERHFTSQFFVDFQGVNESSNQARLESASFDHADTFTSKSGETWTPERYHAPSSFAARSLAVASAVESFAAPAVIDVDPDEFHAQVKLPDVEVGPAMAVPALARPAMSRMLATAAAAPLAADPKKIPIRDLYQLSNRNKANGPVRKGRYSGRTLIISFPNAHGNHGPGTPGYDYHDPDGVISDANTGKKLGSCNSKIKFGSSVAYGYYVFVACGADDSGSPCISYSEDGIEWKNQVVGPKGTRCWSLVVGARE
jgi:hypothetical protein